MLAGGEKEDSGWYDDERLGEGEWRFRTGRSQAGEGLPALGTCGVSTGMRQTVGRGCEHFQRLESRGQRKRDTHFGKTPRECQPTLDRRRIGRRTSAADRRMIGTPRCSKR